MHYSIFTLSWIALFLLQTSDVLAQNNKKASIARYKEITSLPIDSIRTPKYKYLANEYTAEQFVTYFFRHGNGNSSKDLGYEFIDSLYTDSLYTYYLHRSSYYPVNLIRVNSNDLDKFHISKIDGPKLRQRFIDEIVPEKDKKRVKKWGANCSMGIEYGDFKYFYNKVEKKILIKYKWKITCDFIRVINSEYCAYYNLDDELFYR